MTMKYNQSKYCTEIAKQLIFNCKLRYICIDHLLIIRKTTRLPLNSDVCDIFSAGDIMQNAFNIYYVIEVYPTFDEITETNQYRMIFHCLKHIPQDYMHSNFLVKHDVELFNGEELFMHDFKKAFMSMKDG